MREACFVKIDDIHAGHKLPTPPVKLGYMSHNKDEIWFETSALPQLFPGLNEKSVIAALKESSLLKMTNDKRNQVWRTPLSKQRAFYVVSISQLLGAKDKLENKDQDAPVEPAREASEPANKQEEEVPF